MLGSCVHCFRNGRLSRYLGTRLYLLSGGCFNRLVNSRMSRLARRRMRRFVRRGRVNRLLRDRPSRLRKRLRGGWEFRHGFQRRRLPSDRGGQRGRSVRNVRSFCRYAACFLRLLITGDGFERNFRGRIFLRGTLHGLEGRQPDRLSGRLDGCEDRLSRYGFRRFHRNRRRVSVLRTVRPGCLLNIRR